MMWADRTLHGQRSGWNKCLSAMQASTMFILIMLCVANNGIHLSRKSTFKDTWKSRNRRELERTRRLQDTKRVLYYLPRTYKFNLAFNHSYTPSFEDVVSQLKEIGILDLPTVSVTRSSNPSQSKPVTESSLPESRIRMKRCNPCGGCPSADSKLLSYSIEGVAAITAKKIQCSGFICFNGSGECRLITRHFMLYGKDGGRWKEKTVEFHVGCACHRTSSG